MFCMEVIVCDGLHYISRCFCCSAPFIGRTNTSQYSTPPPLNMTSIINAKLNLHILTMSPKTACYKHSKLSCVELTADLLYGTGIYCTGVRNKVHIIVSVDTKCILLNKSVLMYNFMTHISHPVYLA